MAVSVYCQQHSSLGEDTVRSFLHFDPHAEPSDIPPFASNSKTAITSPSHYNILQKENLGVKLGVFITLK
jgi:hypothetical protein